MLYSSGYSPRDHSRNARLSKSLGRNVVNGKHYFDGVQLHLENGHLGNIQNWRCADANSGACNDLAKIRFPRRRSLLYQLL